MIFLMACNRTLLCSFLDFGPNSFSSGFVLKKSILYIVCSYRFFWNVIFRVYFDYFWGFCGSSKSKRCYSGKTQLS